MRDAEHWTPSKYVMRRGRWRASSDPAQVGIGSRLVTDAVAARYQQHLPTYARGRLIDLGCGQVPLYGAYRGLVGDVTCVDWAASPHPSQHLDLQTDLSAPLPFAGASFDTILLSDVLEHVPTPERLWFEMARLLAPGGHAIVNLPFLYGIHEVPHDYARYTEFALRRFARGAGLNVLLLEAVGGSAEVIADLLAKHLAQVPVIGRPMAIGLQGVASWWGARDWGRRFATFSATRFPLGYFMVVQRPVD